MKKIYMILTMLLGMAGATTAQVTVEFDANATFLGFANVFETPANGGGFVFGSAWGVPDLKTVIDTGAGTATLQPNFNTWDPADPFWVTPTGEPNKVFEGNTYVEDNTLIGSEVTFTGNCQSFTIDAGYAVKAFIRVFNSDFSVVKEENTLLTAGQNFSVTYTDVEGTDTFLQYGFAVTGLVADPADEAALGSVVVAPPLLNVGEFDASQISAFPNPASDIVNVKSPIAIDQIEVYNALGQQVISQNFENTQVALNISGLSQGIYLARINTSQGNKVIQIIKE